MRKTSTVGVTKTTAIIIALVVGLVIGGIAGYLAVPAAPAEVTATVTKTEATTVEKTIATTVGAPAITLAIEHFSVIAGTTWSGAHDRAARRLTTLYPWLTYIKDEEVMPDKTIPAARDMIAQGANIVVGNAEFMALPLKDIADENPDVYFVGIIASDLSTERNFLRYFPRQYQAMYLEGLIAGALTKANKIGVVSGPICVQNIRRVAAFYLGIREVNPDATLYLKYAGDWYVPDVESDVAKTLVDTYGVDVLTHYTDSVAPLRVAEEKGIWFIGKDMDIVGEYGWSTTDTVAVSFDTRWEVGYDKMIKEYLAGCQDPKRVWFIGMNEPMAVPADNEILPGETLIPIVDLQNDGKIGVDAISPKARPLIPDLVISLIRLRREQMMQGVWDPFVDNELVSGGTGLELPYAPVPHKGRVMKAAGVIGLDEPRWDEGLLAWFNFHLEGIEYIP